MPDASRLYVYHAFYKQSNLVDQPDTGPISEINRVEDQPVTRSPPPRGRPRQGPPRETLTLFRGHRTLPTSPGRTNRLHNRSHTNSAGGRNLALIGQLLIIVSQHRAKMNNHEFRARSWGWAARWRSMAASRSSPRSQRTITTSQDGSAYSPAQSDQLRERAG